MRSFFMFLLTFMVITLTTGGLQAQDKSTQIKKEQVSKTLGDSFGCTCAGLKACEVGACALEFFGAGCTSSGGRGDAICMCLTGAMNHCSNYHDILNDPSCAQQLNDFEHNDYGNCNGSKP